MNDWRIQDREAPSDAFLFIHQKTRQKHVADPPSLTLDFCLAEKLSHTTPTKPP